MSNFDLLHPAVQHHIVNSLGWSSLRPLQEQAIQPVLEGHHALLIAPTAGGKTEAAVLPVLSRMLSSNWQGLSVLYVCPLRALINNLEFRLQHYAGLVGRQCRLWHGDVSASVKSGIEAEPPDVLLTTPESLEVMLVVPRIAHERLLRNVQVVIVDEIHAFLSEDRGWHLLALLERVDRLSRTPLQRIGLSATVGNPRELLSLLVVPHDGVRNVVAPSQDDAAGAEVTLDYVGSLKNAATVISRLHRGEKRLVFCDSRSKVEDLALQLRATGVDTYVSHSSLSLDERQRAESAFACGNDCVIVATSTLELGIDVGDLNRVIQIDAPTEVASFLQRLGRTGRRAGTTRNYLFLSTCQESLMQAAALMKLWGSGFVEKVVPPAAPVHILSQQIMALVLQERGLGAADWQGWIGNMPGFKGLPSSDVDALLTHMLDSGILFEDSGLWGVGRQGEEEFGRRNFMDLLSAFVSEPLFSVRHGVSSIGHVHPMTFARWDVQATVLVLGGRSWLVTHVDWDRKVAYVEPSQSEGKSRWAGAGQPIRFAVCQAIREVLLGAELPGSLSKRAETELADVRSEFAWLEAGATSVVRDPAGEVRWWTFGGLHANGALAAQLREAGVAAGVANNLSVKLAPECLLSEVEQALLTLRGSNPESFATPVNDKALDGLKFSACLPEWLARRMLSERMTDVAAIKSVLAENVALTTLA